MKQQVRKLRDRFAAEGINITYENAKELYNDEGVSTKPFADVIKLYKFELRQKKLFVEAIEAIRAALEEVYDDGRIAETMITFILNTFEDHTTSKPYEMNNAHYTKVMDKTIAKLLDITDNDVMRMSIARGSHFKQGNT